jgi:hypothetical protein
MISSFSASEFGTPAIGECKRALTQRVIMLAEVNELVRLLEEPDTCLRRRLNAKYLAASVDRQLLYYRGLDTIRALVG